MAKSDADTPTTADSLEKRARRRVALKTGWLMHAAVFVLVNAGLALLWWLRNVGGEIDPGWGHHHRSHFPLWGWGLGLAIHGAVVLIKLQGQGVTERLVAREIEALKRRDGIQ